MVANPANAVSGLLSSIRCHVGKVGDHEAHVNGSAPVNLVFEINSPPTLLIRCWQASAHFHCLSFPPLD